MIKQTITPFLWFDDDAEEAVNTYVALFADSKILQVARYPEGSPGRAGKVMTVDFQLEGRRFMALNGGPHYELSPAFSMFVTVETQAEIDHYWSALLAGGGHESQCGWLQDRFGLSWQIIPRQLMELMADKDAARSQRVMQAMLKMVKIDLAALQAAHQGKA